MGGEAGGVGRRCGGEGAAVGRGGRGGGTQHPRGTRAGLPGGARGAGPGAAGRSRRARPLGGKEARVLRSARAPPALLEARSLRSAALRGLPVFPPPAPPRSPPLGWERAAPGGGKRRRRRRRPPETAPSRRLCSRLRVDSGRWYLPFPAPASRDSRSLPPRSGQPRGQGSLSPRAPGVGLSPEQHRSLAGVPAFHKDRASVPDPRGHAKAMSLWSLDGC